jgi:hypothetical protein
MEKLSGEVVFEKELEECPSVREQQIPEQEQRENSGWSMVLCVKAQCRLQLIYCCLCLDGDICCHRCLHNLLDKVQIQCDNQSPQNLAQSSPASSSIIVSPHLIYLCFWSCCIFCLKDGGLSPFPSRSSSNQVSSVKPHFPSVQEHFHIMALVLLMSNHHVLFPFVLFLQA